MTAPCLAADVIDPDVTRAPLPHDEELTITWRCCGTSIVYGSHSWKRCDDDDVFNMHAAARRKATADA